MEERLANVTNTIAKAEANYDIQEPSVPRHINFNEVAYHPLQEGPVYKTNTVLIN